MLLLICLVAGTSAYFIKQNSIRNQLVLGEVKTEVNEKFDANNKLKENVSIKNIGNVPIYVRVALIISWKDEEGNILEGTPKENEDYSIKFSESSNCLPIITFFIGISCIIVNNPTERGLGQSD